MTVLTQIRRAVAWERSEEFLDWVAFSWICLPGPLLLRPVPAPPGALGAALSLDGSAWLPSSRAAGAGRGGSPHQRGASASSISTL